MKELEGLFEWLNSFNKPEQGCDSLIEWLELEQKTAYMRGGRIMARIGLGVLVFGLALLLAVYVAFVRMVPLNTASPSHLSLLWGAATLGIGLVFTGVFDRLWGRRIGALPQTSRNSEAMRVIAHLREITGYRGLRRELGEHGVIELNEGATLYLRCRSVLTSDAWASSSPDDPWIEARDGMLRAMESAMERLTVFVTKKRSFAEIAPVLEEMRTATNEAERITSQRSLQAGSTGRDLRSSLARMKELAAAEEELLRVQDSR